jgi:hypothetical protein
MGRGSIGMPRNLPRLSLCGRAILPLPEQRWGCAGGQELPCAVR